MTAQTPPRTRTALFLCILGVASLLLAPAVPAQPIPGTMGPTRTITWALNSTDGLDAAGIAIENETAVLEWVSEDVNWSRGPDFVDRGSYEPTLSVGPSGIELAADSRNHITDGDFSAPGPGSWEPLPTQNMRVEKEAGLGDAFFGHSSIAPTNNSFDPLDRENDPNWTSTGSVDSTCSLSWASPGQNGSGKMIKCTIQLGSLPGSWAGVARTSANWSAYDRLLLWVFAESVAPFNWSFQLRAMAGLTPYATTPQLLRSDWQEIVVDLTELGPDREALTNVRFLVVGSTISAHVDFDDIRLANAKSFDETARLRQNFTKPSVTTSSEGSATLRFDYQVVDGSGVDAFDFRVNFSGENGSQEVAIPVILGTAVADYYVDVSPFATAAGPVSIEFSVRIAINGVVASNALVRIDNVRVEFPNRRGGSFLSDVIDFDLISQVPRVRWIATIPTETAAWFRLRSGNESDPSGPTWSSWRIWDTPGPSSASLGPSRYVQLGLDLDTTNASRTPVVHSVQVDARHRSATGSIETAFELRDEDFFGSWTLMRVHTSPLSDTGVTFFVGRGGQWEEVRPDGRLASVNSKAISWRVLVATSDGVDTPRLSSVVLTYERSLIPNSLASVLLSPYTFAAMLAIVVLGYSAHRAVIRRRSFAVDDVFLISREGRLMMHNTRRMRPDRDEDILSGMLTAILAFVKDSDPEGNGELHNFKIGDKTTVVEKGMHSYVAAVYSGIVPRWAAKDLRRFLKDLEARFGSAFAQWSGDPEDLQGLQEFTARFVSRTRYRPSNATNGRAA